MTTPERRDVCKWKYMDWPCSSSDYDADCGLSWSFVDGDMKDNGVKFCPGCGGAIEFVPPEEDEEDDDGDE